MRSFRRRIRCYFNLCPGYVVSGWRGGVGNILCIGWCCSDCGKVKHYGPSRIESILDRDPALWYDGPSLTKKE
jgi:hypothetical protein